MKKFFAILCLVWSASAFSQALPIAANALVIADYLQTRQIAKHPEQYSEANPLLGTNPSIGRVNVHFATVLTTMNLLAMLYPTQSDDIYKVVFYIEAANVGRNLMLGVKIQY